MFVALQAGILHFCNIIMLQSFKSNTGCKSVLKSDLEDEGMRKDLHSLKEHLIIKLSELGLEAAICPECGKIFDKSEGAVTCRECQDKISFTDAYTLPSSTVNYPP